MMTRDEIIGELLCRSYYETVYIEFIKEAVDEAMDYGLTDLDEIDEYIRINCI